MTPDQAAEKNRFAITLPHVGSLILTHSWDGRFAGLKDFPREQRPPVTSILPSVEASRRPAVVRTAWHSRVTA